MALLNFMRPKWKHGKEKVRLKAVRELSKNEIGTLTIIIREDESQSVVSAAIDKLNDFEQLEGLLRFDLDPGTRQKIHHKTNRLLRQQLLETTDEITVEETLLRLDDPEILFEIATTSENPDLRLKTVHRIDDQELLCRVMEQNCGKSPALAALNKIEDQTLLERLCQKASNRSIRRLAAEKLATVNTALDPAEGQKDVREQELKQFVKEAEDLTSTIDFDLAAGHLAELEKSWSRIDPQGDHPLRDAFDAEKNRFKKHQQNFLIQEQEESAQEEDYAKKIAAYETVCTTIEALIDSPAENVREKFKAAEALWNINPVEKNDPIVFELADRFEKACKSFNATAKAVDQEKQFLRDLSAGCGEVENLLAGKNIESAQKRLLGLEKRFQSKNCQHCDSEEIRQRLDGLKHKIQKKEQEQYEKKQQIIQDNLAKRRAIIDKIEALVQAENQAEAEKQAKDLQAEWNSLAALPGEEGKEEKKRYQKAQANFSELQDQFYHERDWQRWANKNNKEELCKQAEALDNEENFERLASTIKNIQTQWKKIGPVPKKEADALWERFHTACDRNYNRLLPYFEEKKKIRAENLNRKEEICREAEDLADSDQWRETSEALKDKQAQWKKLGYASKKDDEVLYKRFRDACDVFFNRRTEHYKQQDEKRAVFLKEKIKLCEAAETLAKEPQWQNGKKIRDLQAQWKKTSSAPRDQEQKIWQRFRAACDSFYNWLDGERQGNLEKKEQLCQKITGLATLTDETNLNDIAAQLRELQQQWKEIGPVPNEVKDEIWQRFNTPCEDFFNLRRERFKKLDQERQENQKQKEAILAEAELTIHEKEGREATEKLQDLQKQWKKIGLAPRKMEQELFKNFQTLCNEFFQGKRQKHEDIMASRLENLKQKEAICVQLENLVEMNPSAPPLEPNKALSLAEQFKIAREANFMMAGSKDHKGRKKEEVIRLQQEWKKIGPVPGEHNKPIWARYNNCLDSFFKKNQASSNNVANREKKRTEMSPEQNP